MQTSTIKFSQIEDRIDAEYYKPEFLKTERLFSRIRNQSGIPSLLDALSYIKGYAFESEYYTKEGNVGIYRVSDIENGINFDDVVRVPDFFWEKFKRFRIRPRDIIMTVTGNTVGKAILIPDEIPQLLMNQNAAIWRTKEKVNQFYLYIFVIAKPFQTKIERIARAGTRPFIGIDILKETFIPIPSQSFQQKIEKMVKEAQKKRKLADEKYKEAEEILNKELGLENLDLSTQKTFEAKFSEAEDRFDPEYYQPKHKKIILKLRSQKSKSVGEIVKISSKKIDPSKNPPEEIKYVELANVNGSNGMIENCETYKHWQLPGRAKMLIKNGDVLVSSLGGSIDKVGLVTKEYDNQVASTGFFVINSNVLTSETLFLIFRNKIASWQLQRNTRGAIMSAISENEFKNIIIPILSQPLQQKISSLIQESFKLHQEAKELIDRAKKEVEEMIENK